MRYFGGYLTLFNYLRTLPRTEAWTARAGLAMVVVIVVAMPVLAWVHVHLPTVAFQAVDGAPAGISEAGFALTLLAFAVGWAYALAGAAQGPGVLWLLVAAQYVYFVVFLGLARTPFTYLQLIPFVLAVVVGALTPNVRPWAQYLLIALVASIMARTAPVTDLLHGVPWQAAWLPVAALLALLHHMLARRPWLSAGARVGLAALVSCVYVTAIAGIAGRGDLATALNVSLSGTFEILSLLWFVLGAAFVGGGLGLAKLVREGVDTLTPAYAMPWLAGLGWVALAAWTLLRPPSCPSCDTEIAFPVTPVTLGVLAAFLAALAAGARRRVVSRDWLAGWLVAALAAVLVLRAYATHGLRNVVAAGAGAETGSALAIAGFLYSITWEVSGQLAHIPLSTARLARPSPLLLFLAAVMLISGAALFGTTAGLTAFQKYIILNQYQGAAALSIPLALLAGARMWPALTPSGVARGVTAFYWGAVLAVPAFLLRAAAPAAWVGDAAMVAAPSALGIYLLSRWADARAPLTAVAVGTGAALGFMVSLTQRVLVGVLQDIVFMIALLLKNAPLRGTAFQIRDWQTAAITIPREDGTLAAIATILAAAATWAAAAYLSRSACHLAGRTLPAPTEAAARGAKP